MSAPISKNEMNKLGIQSSMLHQAHPLNKGSMSEEPTMQDRAALPIAVQPRMSASQGGPYQPMVVSMDGRAASR